MFAGIVVAAEKEDNFFPVILHSHFYLLCQLSKKVIKMMHTRFHNYGFKGFQGQGFRPLLPEAKHKLIKSLTYPGELVYPEECRK